MGPKARPIPFPPSASALRLLFDEAPLPQVMRGHRDQLDPRQTALPQTPVGEFRLSLD